MRIDGRLRRPTCRRCFSSSRSGRSDGGSFDAGIQFALERVLVDPDFLLRVHRDPPACSSAGARRHGVRDVPLTDLELASRLSFFLWNSIPDERLIDAAERGQLSQPAVLEQQVRRMLADPRATRALVGNFAAQWLNLRRVAEVIVDPDVYPDFDESLLQAFEEETRLFLTSTLARGSQRPRSAARRLHVRQRTARASLRDCRDLRQPLPARHAAEPRSTRRTARQRIDPRDDLLSEQDLAGASRQMAARQHVRYAAATAAARREHDARGTEGRAHCRRPFANGWRSIARTRCARRVMRRSIRWDSRSRTSTRSAAGGRQTSRASLSMRAATLVSGATVQGLVGPACAAARAAGTISGDGDGEAPGVCAWPPPRVLRSARRSPDCSRCGRQRLPVVVARHRHREESRVSDAGAPGRPTE